MNIGDGGLAKDNSTFEQSINWDNTKIVKTQNTEKTSGDCNDVKGEGEWADQRTINNDVKGEGEWVGPDECLQQIRTLKRKKHCTCNFHDIYRGSGHNSSFRVMLFSIPNQNVFISRYV